MDSAILQRDGHSFAQPPAFNTAGYVYIAFVSLYTALLLIGTVCLWAYRRRPEIRMRNIVITILAIVALHVYVAALFVVYPLNRSYKCDTEFWYMSIIFPLGIALFQASNVRLMGYSKAQSGLMDLKCWGKRKQNFSLRPKQFKKWYGSLTYTKATYIFICLGLIVQTIVTFILFFASRRFSPHTGIFGKEVDPVECRRGPEWIPSVLWQFTWTWIIGPYVLFKTRHIKDTHLWAWQTRLAVLSGLPGTPMWLAFLYCKSDRLAAINAWFPPAMWFGPGLITMQVSSIVFPLIDIYRSPSLRRPSSANSTASKDTANSTLSKNSAKSADLAINFGAFESVLNNNINPLLHFAATRDFTAENIGFLQDVRDFKKKWNPYATVANPNSGNKYEKEMRRDMFYAAALIYFEHVCPGTSQAYINLDSRAYHDLQGMFKDLTYEPPCESGRHSPDSAKDMNVIAPWMSPVASRRPSDQLMTIQSVGSGETTLADVDPFSLDQNDGTFGTTNGPQPGATAKRQVSSPTDQANKAAVGTVHSKLGATSEFYNAYNIPAKFGIDVFKAAEKSIKYLVYTNTWRKFVVATDVESINESITSADKGILGGIFYGTEMKNITKVNAYEVASVNSDNHEENAGEPKVDARCSACRNRDELRAAAIARISARKLNRPDWDFLDH